MTQKTKEGGRMKGKGRMDMTGGSLGDKIIQYAIPLAATENMVAMALIF